MTPFLEFFRDACPLLAAESAWEHGPYCEGASTLTQIAESISRKAVAVPVGRSLLLGECLLFDRDRWLDQFELKCVSILREAAKQSSEAIAEVAIRVASLNLQSQLESMAKR